MSNITVTEKQINELIDHAEINVHTVFGKCTVVTMQLQNGFILTESSACVDPANYNEQLGKEICIDHIRNRLWELEGYFLQKTLYQEKNTLRGALCQIMTDARENCRSSDCTWCGIEVIC